MEKFTIRISCFCQHIRKTS